LLSVTYIRLRRCSDGPPSNSSQSLMMIIRFLEPPLEILQQMCHQRNSVLCVKY
jgi:hypothetical protein